MSWSQSWLWPALYPATCPACRQKISVYGELSVPRSVHSPPGHRDTLLSCHIKLLVPAAPPEIASPSPRWLYRPCRSQCGGLEGDASRRHLSTEKTRPRCKRRSREDMASRPAKWRILAVTNGVDLPTTGEATPSRSGPLQEFADLGASEAEVRHTANLLGLSRQIPARTYSNVLCNRWVKLGAA